MQDQNNNTTEIITVVASIAAFLAGIGVIDVDLGKVVDTAGQVKTIADGVDTSSVKSIVEGVYKIVCLILGGGIIMTYLKYKAAKEQKVIIQKVPETKPEEPKEEPAPQPEILVEEEVVVDEALPEEIVTEDVGADKDYGLK